MTVDEIKAKIKYEAEKNGLEPDILDRLIFSESSYNPKAVGVQTRYGKARGIAQFLPATGKRYGVNDLYDPNQSIEGAAKYLSDLKKANNGDIWLALADYKGYTTDKRLGAHTIKKIFSRLESKGYVSASKDLSTDDVEKDTSGGLLGYVMGAAAPDKNSGSSLFLKVSLTGIGGVLTIMGFWLLANSKNLGVVAEAVK